MARKKNWVDYNSLKCTNKTKSNDLDITWSSSSSDSEDILFYKYRKKIKRNNHVNSVINLEEKCDSSPKSNNSSQNLSPIIGQSQLELSPTLNAIINANSPESPVIDSNLKIRLWKEHIANKKLVRSEHFSDKFNFLNTNNGNDNSAESPVIDNSLKIRLSKEHIANKKLAHSESFSDKFNMLNTSIDNFYYNISGNSSSSESQKEDAQSISEFSEKTSNINLKAQFEKRNYDIDSIESLSENSNDVFSQASAQINIDSSSPSKSEDGQSLTISQFSTSQEGRNTFINQSSNDSVALLSGETSQVSPFTGSVMYYHKVPQKKKYKKGGLMNQLQKALKSKMCNISMWQHEIYLGRTDFCQEFLHIRVIEIHVEFSCRICTSYFIIPENPEDNSRKCVLVLDSSVHHGVQCLQNLKVCKPYSVSYVNYCNENICCYYNVSKILFDS